MFFFFFFFTWPNVIHTFLSNIGINYQIKTDHQSHSGTSLNFQFQFIQTNLQHKVELGPHGTLQSAIQRPSKKKKKKKKKNVMDQAIYIHVCKNWAEFFH